MGQNYRSLELLPRWIGPDDRALVLEIVAVQLTAEQILVIHVIHVIHVMPVMLRREKHGA